MPYFFILVFFLLFLLSMLAAAGVLFFTRFRRAAPYVLGAALGSVPGFVGANALLFYGLTHLPNNPAQGSLAVPGTLSTLVGIAAVGALILVPVVVSGIGVVLGAIAGMYTAWRITRKKEGLSTSGG
ncbi:hypothetical protein ACFQT0_24365 [Hymenobacter humi]|uniref:DUF5518 domain-containing protein n=1 Tax=Hymenobacter humi TaxID=1411620 RepID=A0ABW2UCU6_9BACT